MLQDCVRRRSSHDTGDRSRVGICENPAVLYISWQHVLIAKPEAPIAGGGLGRESFDRVSIETVHGYDAIRY